MTVTVMIVVAVTVQAILTMLADVHPQWIYSALTFPFCLGCYTNPQTVVAFQIYVTLREECKHLSSTFTICCTVFSINILAPLL